MSVHAACQESKVWVQDSKSKVSWRGQHSPFHLSSGVVACWPPLEVSWQDPHECGHNDVQGWLHYEVTSALDHPQGESRGGDKHIDNKLGVGVQSFSAFIVSGCGQLHRLWKWERDVGRVGGMVRESEVKMYSLITACWLLVDKFQILL